jgi:hypothetical protein
MSTVDVVAEAVRWLNGPQGYELGRRAERGDFSHPPRISADERGATK